MPSKKPTQTEVAATNAEGIDNMAREADTNGWVVDPVRHAELYRRFERGLARRLYEVWRTSGELGGEKWEWTNLSTRQQSAWVFVARACAGPAYLEQFGPKEIAQLMHA